MLLAECSCRWPEVTAIHQDWNYWRDSSPNAGGSSSPFPGQCKYVWPKSSLHFILSKAFYQRKHFLLCLLSLEAYQMIHHPTPNSMFRGHSLECTWIVKGFFSEGLGISRKKDGWNVWHWHVLKLHWKLWVQVFLLMNVNIKFTVKWYNLVCTAILYLRFNSYIPGMVFSLYFLASSLQNWDLCDPTLSEYVYVSPSRRF